MARVFHVEESPYQIVALEDFFERLRGLEEEPREEPVDMDMVRYLEGKGFQEDDTQTLAAPPGSQVNVTVFVAAPAREPSEAESGATALLLEGVKRLAASNERMATCMEVIASQAHVHTPPMTVEQVAAYAAIRPKTVYDWKSKGWIKPLADNAKPLLFERDEVVKALKRLRGPGS